MVGVVRNLASLESTLVFSRVAIVSRDPNQMSRICGGDTATRFMFLPSSLSMVLQASIVELLCAQPAHLISVYINLLGICPIVCFVFSSIQS